MDLTKFVNKVVNLDGKNYYCWGFHNNHLLRLSELGKDYEFSGWYHATNAKLGRI